MAGALMLGALVGCATPQTDRLLKTPTALPPRAEVSSVPFFPQEKYYCGPAALAMVLSWSGLPVTQEEIGAQVYTPGREGTLQTDMIAAARRNGRLAVPVTRLPDLTAELAAGHPVVVFQNLGFGWFPVWHYAVAIGYDAKKDSIILRSGHTRRKLMSARAFDAKWSPSQRCRSPPCRAPPPTRGWCGTGTRAAPPATRIRPAQVR